MTDLTIEDTDALVIQAQSLLQSAQLANAIGKCGQVLAQDPNHRDALYTLAVAERYSGRLVIALQVTDRLIQLDPSFGMAHQERGHCLRELGDVGAALGSYQQAVARNAALPASWKMIADYQQRAGHHGAADYALSQFAYLSDLPPELLGAANMIEEGRYLKAERVCRAFLQANGHNVEAMRLLASVGTKFNSFEEAEFLLESCIVLEPENAGAHYDYVDVLHKRQKFAKALEQATVLRSRSPKSPQIEMLYANENLAVGNFEVALDVYGKLQVEAPGNPGINLTYGHALKTVGRQDDAVAAYRRAYVSKSDYGDAYWSLANLKTYRFSDMEIAQMRFAEAAITTALTDRYHLCFALGKAYEDRGEFGASFDYYDRGNQLKRAELKYDPARIAAEMRLQTDLVTQALIAQFSGAGCQAPDPIFIVGLPRSGSTLLEQVLASHSQIEGTMELPNILALAHKLDGRRRVGDEARYPGNLDELTREDLAAFGASYIRDTMIHRKSGAPFFIDKMPNNFKHIGLIHLILPRAKIIDARRGAMACCFSGFKQLFAEGQEFTYGLDAVGTYYRDYVRLMEHWDDVLPGKILRVQYEDVVADLEPQVRRLLDFCDLSFEESCIRFHETERAIRTASSEQVRQPIFTSGMDQWENFSLHLDPLRTVLGPELSAQ